MIVVKTLGAEYDFWPTAKVNSCVKPKNVSFKLRTITTITIWLNAVDSTSRTNSHLESKSISEDDTYIDG